MRTLALFSFMTLAMTAQPYYRTFSAKHPVKQRVKPGEVVLRRRSIQAARTSIASNRPTGRIR